MVFNLWQLSLPFLVFHLLDRILQITCQILGSCIPPPSRIGNLFWTNLRPQLLRLMLTADDLIFFLMVFLFFMDYFLLFFYHWVIEHIFSLSLLDLWLTNTNKTRQRIWIFITYIKSIFIDSHFGDVYWLFLVSQEVGTDIGQNFFLEIFIGLLHEIADLHWVFIQVWGECTLWLLFVFLFLDKLSLHGTHFITVVKQYLVPLHKSFEIKFWMLELFLIHLILQAIVLA